MMLNLAFLYSYARYVTKSVLKIDTLLKVVMTPEDPPEGFINNYLILVPCQSFSDFQKVLDLKVRPFSSPIYPSEPHNADSHPTTREYEERNKTIFSIFS